MDSRNRFTAAPRSSGAICPRPASAGRAATWNRSKATNTPLCVRYPRRILVGSRSGPDRDSTNRYSRRVKAWISSAVVPVATRTGMSSGSGGETANISSYIESIWRTAVPPTAPVPPRNRCASR